MSLTARLIFIFFSRRAAEVPPVPAPGIEPGLPSWEGALGATRAQPLPIMIHMYFIVYVRILNTEREREIDIIIISSES